MSRSRRDASASVRGRRSVPTRAFGSSSSRATAKDYHTHIVKPGENLSYIARDFATSISALREANGMRHATGDVIYEGQEIRVPVTPDNHGVIELIRAKSIVAKNAESSKTASTSSKATRAPRRRLQARLRRQSQRQARPVRSLHLDSPLPFPQARRRQHPQPLADRDDAPPKGPAPPGSRARPLAARRRHLPPRRDARLRVVRQDAPRVSVAKAREKSDRRASAVFVAATPDDRAWADKHLAAHSFPTIIAMPKRGGVYKYGLEHMPALLGAFADEACRAIPPATSVPPRLSPSQSVANAVATSLVGAVGVEAAGAVGGAAELATPFVLAGAGIALFVTTALKFVELAIPGPGDGETRAESPCAGPRSRRRARRRRVRRARARGSAAAHHRVRRTHRARGGGAIQVGGGGGEGGAQETSKGRTRQAKGRRRHPVRRVRGKTRGVDPDGGERTRRSRAKVLLPVRGVVPPAER